MNTSTSNTAKAQPPVREEDLDLLPDPDAIEQRPIGGGKRAVLYLMAGFIGCALLWASLAEVDETVMARGRLVSTERKSGPVKSLRLPQKRDGCRSGLH